MRDSQLFREISADLVRAAAVEGDSVGRYLASQFGLGKEKSGEVQEEFCRFVYLLRIAQAPLAAPPVLAALWHEFSPAREQGGGRGHREPLTTGLWSLAKSPAYRQTLDLYQAEFGAPPPRVWPSPGGLIRTFFVNVVMLGGFVLASLATFLGLEWSAVSGVGVCGLCILWLHFFGPMGMTGPEE